MVDEDGKPLVVFHQTTKDIESKIFAEGFRLDKPLARVSDESVPDGIFFKPSDSDIGLSGKDEAAQIPVYLSVQNPFIVPNRDLVQDTLDDSVYDGIADEIKRIDDKYDSEIDAIYADESMSALEQNAKAKSVLDIWGPEIRAKTTEGRKRLTEVIKSRGFDGMIIGSDVGSFGRETKTYVALDPTQIKSVENQGTFDPAVS